MNSREVLFYQTANVLINVVNLVSHVQVSNLLPVVIRGTASFTASPEILYISDLLKFYFNNFNMLYSYTVKHLYTDRKGSFTRLAHLR